MRPHSTTALRRSDSTTERGFWLAWGATLTFFAGFYSLLEPLTRHLVGVGLSDAQIGLVLGLFGVASLIGRPLAGALSDRSGPRTVMLVGAAALLLGSAPLPAATDLPALLGLRLLQAGGYVAFTTAGTAMAVALSPPERRAGRMAIFGAAANVAISLAPAAMGALLLRIPLPAAFWLIGGLALVAGLAALLAPDIRPTLARETAAPGLPAAIWPAMAVAACLGAGFGAFLHYIPLLAERRGPHPVGLIFSVYGAAIILTRLVARGWLDRAGVRRSVLLGAALHAAGLALAAFAADLALLLLAAALIAAGSGIFHPALIAHHARLLPAAPGRASAAFYLGFDLGLGAGAWLLGLALQAGGLAALYLSALGIVALGAALTPLLGSPAEPYLPAQGSPS